MVLKDSAVLFLRKKTNEDDRYAPDFRRVELYGVMVFEKMAAGEDNRREGSCVIYVFPSRSRAVEDGRAIPLPEVSSGDLCVIGPCEAGFDPIEEGAWRVCAVRRYDKGSGCVNHVVLEAVG